MKELRSLNNKGGFSLLNVRAICETIQIAKKGILDIFGGGGGNTSIQIIKLV